MLEERPFSSSFVCSFALFFNQATQSFAVACESFFLSGSFSSGFFRCFVKWQTELCSEGVGVGRKAVWQRWEAEERESSGKVLLFYTVGWWWSLEKDVKNSLWRHDFVLSLFGIWADWRTELLILKKKKRHMWKRWRWILYWCWVWITVTPSPRTGLSIWVFAVYSPNESSIWPPKITFVTNNARNCSFPICPEIRRIACLMLVYILNELWTIFHSHLHGGSGLRVRGHLLHSILGCDQFIILF